MDGQTVGKELGSLFNEIHLSLCQECAAKNNIEAAKTNIQQLKAEIAAIVQVAEGFQKLACPVFEIGCPYHQRFAATVSRLAHVGCNLPVLELVGRGRKGNHEKHFRHGKERNHEILFGLFGQKAV